MPVPDLPDNELDQIKKLLDVRPSDEAEESDFSYDDIINEFRYTSATTPRAVREAERREAEAIIEDWSGDGAETKPRDDDPVIKIFAPVPRPDRPRKGRAHADEPDEDTKHFMELSKRMQELTELAEKPASGRGTEGGATGEIELTEIVLGSPDRFDQNFQPSGVFLGGDDGDAGDREESRGPRGPSLLSKIIAFLKKPAVPESLTPQQHLARVAPYARTLRIRAVAALILFGALVLLTVLQEPQLLPDLLTYRLRPYTTLFVMALLLILCMLCGVDVLARGLSDLCHLRPGGETMTLFSCLCTLLHVTMIVAASGKDALTVAYTPYCAVSAGSVAFALWGHAHRYASFTRVCKIAVSAGENPDSVLCEDNLWDAQTGFIRRTQPAEDFLGAASQPDIVSRVMRFITPLLLLSCFVFAALSAARHPQDAGYPRVTYFYWALSAIACAAVPMTTFCAFPFVYSRISRRLSHMGAALAGWQGAVEMHRGTFAVLDDTDLFPAGTLSLNGLKALGTHSFDRITAYSASLLSAAGSGLYRAVEPLVRDGQNTLRHVSHLETFEGGFSGDIEGARVMLGTLNFMHRMGIQVSREQSLKNAVYLSVNHDLAGIFAVSYIPSGQTEGALVLMENQKIGTVLAVRDFNITPTLLKTKYGVDPDALEFPVIEERFALSSPEKDLRAKAAALLNREGLCPYAEAVTGGQKLYRFTLVNLMIHLISLVGGMLLVFYFARSTAAGAAAAISPLNVLLFMAIWWALIWVTSLFSHRY